MIKGIDVAYYDRGMNWSLYDWDFAYIKVSEGLVIDSEFRRHWVAAKGHTYRGGYHFFRPFVDPEQSARKCIEYMAGDLGELPLWFDLEVTAADIAGRANIAAKAKSWLSWYEQITGIRPMIYTAQNILYDLSSVDISWMRNYKLCLAQYRYENLSTETRTRILHGILTGAITYTMPSVPPPFTRLAMVQWTGKGNPADVPGYYVGEGGKLAVDFDFYNGDMETFKSEFGLQPLTTELPQEPPTGETMQGKVLVGLNIRAGAGTTFGIIGQLQINDIVEADAKVGGWWHLTRITRAGANVPLPAVQSFAFEGTTQGYIQTLAAPPAAVYPVSAVVTVTNSDGSVSTLSGNFTRQP